jgi:hypothetical protein
MFFTLQIVYTTDRGDKGGEREGEDRVTLGITLGEDRVTLGITLGEDRVTLGKTLGEDRVTLGITLFVVVFVCC